MRITNTTRGDLGLNFATIVPAGGSIEIDNDKLTVFKAIPVIKGWFASGMLVESGVAKGPEPTEEPKPEPVKRKPRAKKGS